MTLTPLRRARVHVVVPCAGTGSRAGTSQPKQYQRVAGLPLVLHTLRALATVPEVSQVLVVVSPGDPFSVGELPPRVSVTDAGGATRAATVWGGLQHLLVGGAAPDDWVLVHDAARCLITPELVQRLITACEDHPVGGLLALPVPDTLKLATADGQHVAATVERNGKWLAQTPQMFRLGALLQALEQAGPGVTDEASAIEATGQAPLLVRSSARNFKVTYPEDFAMAEDLLRGMP